MTNKFFIALLIAFVPLFLQAQQTGYAAVAYDEDAPEDTDDRIHLFVDWVPLFSGCNQSQMHTLEQQFCSNEKIKAFIEDNLRYPEEAKAAGISGKVTVWAVIEKNGMVSSVRIRKSDAKELEAEAVRLIRSMPAWTPARLKEKTVRAFKEITIDFKLPQ
ncbi:MAG TPA: energy transducer TonB [Bacteroidetes bacterium]|nr:energy transducer TonB [Bacteroidota bacterium]